jgi:hypothetical protein
MSAILSIAQEEINAFVSSSKVAAFERFSYEIITNSNCLISPPDFGALEILSGPNQSHSSRILNINGVQSQEVQYKISYTLRAKEKGNYKISPAVMQCDEKILETDAISIKVSEGKEQEIDSDYFLKLSSSKSNVYEGEPFTLTLKYYAKSKPESIEALDLGNVNGLWRQDLVPDRKNYQTNVESINGVRYYSIILREELCFAQRSGKVDLEPYYASLIFSQGFFQRFRKESYSNPLSINIKSIPSDNQDNFNGLVGDFKVSSEISKITAQVGEAIDLKITIKGSGNLQALGNLELKFPKDFNAFEPKINDRTSLSRSGISGEIEYNYVLIPEHYGDFTIPAYKFSYFDLGNKTMKQLSTAEFQIHVEKPADGYGQIIGGQKEVEIEENTIRHIETGTTKLIEVDDILFGKWSYIGLVSTPLSLVFILIFLNRRKAKLSPDQLKQVEGKKAGRIAKVELTQAKEFVEKGQEKEALKSLQNSLNIYFMKKCDLNLSELSKRNISNKLQTVGATTSNLTQFETIWSTIEMGQYAPMKQENLITTIESAETLITELDKII